VVTSTQSKWNPIKYAVPEGRQVMGVKIYMAVIRFVVTP